MDPMDQLYDRLVYRNDVLNLVSLSSHIRPANVTELFTAVTDRGNQPEFCHYASEDVLNEALLRALFGRHYVMNVPYLVAVVTCGFVTNLLNLVVLTRLHMRNSITVLLAALAVSDLFVLSVEIPGLLQYFCFHDLTSRAWVVAFAYLQAFRFMSRALSNGLTVTVGAWRCLAVTWPLRAKQLCTVKRAWIAIVCVAICAFVLAVPVFFAVVYVRCVFNVSFTKAHIKQKVVYVNVLNEDLGLDATAIGGFVISVTYGPCLALSVVTFCLIRSLFRANSQRRLLRVQTLTSFKMSREDRARREDDSANKGSTTLGKDSNSDQQLGGGKKLTLMLLVVLILFVVNNLPSAVAVTSALISSDAVYASQDFAFILDMFTVLDNSLSFPTYFIMSRKFRRTFLRLVGFRGKRPNLVQGLAGHRSPSPSPIRTSVNGVKRTIL